MNHEAKKDHSRLEDVKPAKARKVLASLNAAKAAEGIAGAIEIPRWKHWGKERKRRPIMSSWDR